MILDISWRSQQGTLTDENWDYGGAGIRPGAALFVVADGATSGPSGGTLARRLTLELIDRFMEDGDAPSAEAVIGYLRDIHALIARSFPFDSASYVIALAVEHEPVAVLHAGDCLAARRQPGEPFDWQIQPHSLANAFGPMTIEDIAAASTRNRLTRSFRPKEFLCPDVTALDADGLSELILCTDGFWAGLCVEQQQDFTQGTEASLSGEIDDCSVISIRFRGEDGQCAPSIRRGENFYLAQSF